MDDSYVQFLNNSRFWIQRVFVPIITIIGLIGNSITIVIMTNHRMISSTTIYLAALASFDIIHLLFTFILSLSHYPTFSHIRYYWYLWPYYVMLLDASSNTSIWLTVSFTIERYIVVCFPIKGKLLCTESRAKKVILFVCIVCFMFTIPTPFEWTIVESVNKTQFEAIYSDFGRNDLYKSVYYYLTVLLFTFVPFLLLTIFNCLLIRSVHLSRKLRYTMTHTMINTQESRITVMLISVVLFFLICQLPTALTLLYSAFHTVSDESNEGLLIRGLGNIFNFLLALNSAGNFILYCLLSQKYRNTFQQLLCFPKPKHRNSIVNLVESSESDERRSKEIKQKTLNIETQM